MTVKGEEEPEIPVVDGTQAMQESQQAPPPNYSSAIAEAVPVQPPVQATVDVVAPTDLAGGYEFNVDSAGKMLRVAVPAGGVKAGQRFSAIILSDLGGSATAGGNNPHNIPTGRWRDDLCDCCKFGCCHAQCCLAFWCTACALGQVMTRLKLGKCGDYESQPSPGMTTFRFLFMVTAAYLVVSWIINIVAAAVDDDDNDDFDDNDDDEFNAFRLVRNIIDFIFFIFVLVLTIKTRSFIRSKYQIPTGCCGGCEDCCCSFWCSPCTVCQMARHTADFNQYQAACCSDTGLGPEAPEIV